MCHERSLPSRDHGFTYFGSPVILAVVFFDFRGRIPESRRLIHSIFESPEKVQLKALKAPIACLSQQDYDRQDKISLQRECVGYGGI
jgi:hypothetical protein